MSKTRNERKRQIIEWIECIVGGTVMFVMFYLMCLLLFSMDCTETPDTPEDWGVEYVVQN